MYRPVHTYLFIIGIVQCDALFDPDNGNVSTNGTGFGIGDIATYFCDDGYDLIGNDTITCQSNGSWSGSPPTCQG